MKTLQPHYIKFNLHFFPHGSTYLVGLLAVDVSILHLDTNTYTYDRTPLDERSARLSDSKQHSQETFMHRRDSNPQSQQTSVCRSTP